jgi:hypothetical protein
MTPTPTGVTITATKPDGTTQDITEGVQVLYDLVIQSMDFGSGFLTIEDVEPMAVVADFCGFEGFEEAQRYLENERVQERRRKCAHQRWVKQPRDQRGAIFEVCSECGATRYVEYETRLRNLLREAPLRLPDA